MTLSTKITNEEYIKSLQQRGLDTTNVRKGDADFVDYVTSLGGNVQSLVMDSFDAEHVAEDTALQNKLAAGWQANNFKDYKAIQSYCKANGIKCEVSYVKTSYIVDNYAASKYKGNKNATTGSIAVYTFRDANGGEIKIADANGNGGLETEELFMNEILTGVTADIAASRDAISSQAVNSPVDAASTDGADYSMFKKDDANANGTEDTKEESEENSDPRVNVSSGKFETLVKEQMELRGWSEAVAKEYVLLTYSVDGMEDKDAFNVEIKLDQAA